MNGGTTYVPTAHQKYRHALIAASREGRLHSYNEMKDLAQNLLHAAAGLSDCYLDDMYARMEAPGSASKDKPRMDA